MGQRDAGDSEPAGRSRQEIVSQSARGHLDGQVVSLGMCPDIRTPTHEAQAELRCGALYQSFVCVAAPPPQLVIEMRNCELPPVLGRELRQQVEQHHRV